MAFSKPYARQNRIDLTHLGASGDIAVLAVDGFDAGDLTDIAGSAERAGYRTTMISPKKGLITGRPQGGDEMNFVVDAHPGEKTASAFTGLVLPAGAASVERLRNDQDARLLIADFLRAGAPVCALGESVALVAEIADTADPKSDAVLALKGDLFAADGEDARADARSLFIKALSMSAQAA